MKKILLIIITAMMVFPNVKAQGKYGPDSANCVKYLSFYVEYMKQKNLAEATPFWRKAITYCPPTANQTMLIDGATLMRRQINLNKSNPARRAELIDSLMMLHDMRSITYEKYAVKAYNAKALDMINYYGQDNKNKLFEGLGDITKTLQEKVNPVVLVNRMKLAGELYQQGSLNPEQVMDVYSENTSIFEKIIEASPSDGQSEAMKRDMESLFINSGVANCENLIALYTPRYAATPDDKALVSSIVKFMGASECVDNDLFLQAVESLHSLEPSATTAYYLYKLHSVRENFTDALQYLQQAIDNPSTDDKQDADYYLELGTYSFKKTSNKQQAIEAAKKAAELNPALAGKAYLLIGTVWGSIRCDGNEIESRAQYWVAVDYLNKAKAADESLSEEASRMIAQYRSYFPQQAEAFMYDVIDGSSYTVSCSGMRETTTVRTSK